jgi:4-hydroxybenzoate polyprenyltransferase
VAVEARVLPNQRAIEASEDPGVPARPTLAGHFAICRVDHWFKNVFIAPGIVAACGIDSTNVDRALASRIAIGTLAICLVASSNYVVNEVLDAPTDRAHPVKRHRPVPSGRVSVPFAYVQWLVLAAAGIALAKLVSFRFAATAIALWVMGCVYNIRPLRTKDVPHLDVLTEAFNNPIRMLGGWFIATSSSIAPGSLVLCYWMLGCYFMAIKRYSEYRDFDDPLRAVAYRRSFSGYTPDRLLVAISFYGSSAMLFFGAFIMRYRMELIIAFPFVALVMAMYLALALDRNSAVQHPETLYREPRLMAAVIVCSLVMAIALLVDIPAIPRFFVPTAPTIAHPQ